MDKKTSTITAGNKENEKVFPQSILVDMMMIWMAQDSTKTNYLITHCNHKYIISMFLFYPIRMM